MKKVYLLGLLIIMFGAKAGAQNSAAGTFKGGLKINPSFTWLKTEAENSSQPIVNDGVKFGFSYGVFGDYYFAENYGLSAELRIAHLGVGYTYSPNNAVVRSVERDLSMQFVEIPVTLKMRTNEIGYMRYFGQFGFMPSINIKANADQVLTDAAGGKRTNDNLKVMKDVNPLGLSLVIGAGVEYNLGGSTSLLGGLTFNNGFTNLMNKKADDPAMESYRNFNAKMAYIALNLGVIF